MPEFTLNQDGKTYHLTWELIYKDRRVERYRVTPRDNPKLLIVLENNWPLIREVKKLKHKTIQWRQTAGERMRDKVLLEIIRKIENPGADQPFKSDPEIKPLPKKRNGGGPGKPLGER